jgi:D-glycero-D-manno-heptose 1,7-bisphosphate phosphatase
VTRPAVFLDRDGTLIEDPGHLGDPGRVVVLPGAADGLRRLSEAGFALVVVSNQAGVARGLITEDDVRAVNDRVREVLAAAGVWIDGFYYCPHHPDFTGPCACRKPGTELFQRAAAELGLDVRSSWIVGDTAGDLGAARALGVPAVLVRTGHGRRTLSELMADGAVPTAADLSEAAQLILAASGGTGGGRLQGGRSGAMAEIEVNKTGEDEGGFRFEVQLREAGSWTTHQVTLSREDYEKLGKGSESPEGFVHACFRFLLEREPKESILTRFDVRQIGSYFPEFEREVVKPQQSR